MRRFSAILMLAIFSFSLMSPLFGSDPNANLPACCRRNGKHHCAMAMGVGASQSGPALGNNAKCPMYPGCAFARGGSLAVQTHSTSSVTRADNGRQLSAQRDRFNLRVLSANAHHKRGPPSLSFIG